jgi:UDP-N-acetylglucosamine 2-epimerase (non-hydrolysing)
LIPSNGSSRCTATGPSASADRAKVVVHVVGARPNYMKIAPVYEALRQVAGIRQVLVNTGQHYDDVMARVFLDEFGLPSPDFDLAVGSGSHAVQTAKVMIGFEQICLDIHPDIVIVVGDVNSTMAASIVAAKLLVPVAHVEAGLRSFDREMPEEINRIVTDRLADLLLTPSPDADDNLHAEGVPAGKIRRVGNVMIDTLLRFQPAATLDRLRGRIDVDERGYAVVTLHRPSNVDDPSTFARLLDVMRQIAVRLPIVFPVHPRTRQRMNDAGVSLDAPGLRFVEPLGYLDFLSLTSHARLVLTDSGGLQEESTALGIPCLTLRENTERPITVTEGTNRIVGSDPQRILAGFDEVLAHPPPPRCPELWDGRAAVRVAAAVTEFLDCR